MELEGEAAIKAHVMAALKKLTFNNGAHLTSEQIAKAEPELTAHVFRLTTNRRSPTSKLFSFEEKAREVARKFAANGVTFDNYLQATLKKPSLLIQSPETVEANITGVVAKFADNGLTLDCYLQLALAKPSLFTMSPETVASHITGLVEKFADNGLTLDAYLRTALKCPQLFTMSPTTVARNIADVVKRFADNGVTLEAYIQAALKQPSLLGTPAETIVGHITGLVNRFQAEGLTLDAYLKAALRQPALFATSPATTAGHINMVISMYRDGLIELDHSPNLDTAKPVQPMLNYLLKNPALLCLGDDNLQLRRVFSAVCEGPKGPRTILRKSRWDVEDTLAAALGHSDLKKPVRPPQKLPKDPTAEQERSHAKQVLLRAMVQTGHIKGTLG